jgi:hypothetical protein
MNMEEDFLKLLIIKEKLLIIEAFDLEIKCLKKFVVFSIFIFVFFPNIKRIDRGYSTIFGT